jgi:Zinc finger, C3HC4 type (RING finger)
VSVSSSSSSGGGTDEGFTLANSPDPTWHDCTICNASNTALKREVLQCGHAFHGACLFKWWRFKWWRHYWYTTMNAAALT